MTDPAGSAAGGAAGARAAIALAGHGYHGGTGIDPAITGEPPEEPSGSHS